MSADLQEKKGNVIAETGSTSERFWSHDAKHPENRWRWTTPEEWLDHATSGLFASWKADKGVGPYASRGIANVAHGINHPHRYMARRIKEASDQRVQHQLVKQWIKLLDRYVDLCYGIDP